MPETETTALPEPAFAASPVTDEWDDLRQVLAGDDPPVLAVEDDDEVEDEIEIDAADEEPVLAEVLHETLAELTERVDQLAAELDDERAERGRLADQLDRLASELDAVLGEALDQEREGRAELQEALRQVQATLAEAPVQEWTGPEQRSGEDRRTASERRRGLPARPLRSSARRSDEVVAPVEPPKVEAEPEPEEFEYDDEPVVDDAPSVWKSRLHDVAGSVSAWSSDDIDRLRVD